MRFNITNLKKGIPLLIIVSIFLILSLWYIKRTWVNTVYLDGFVFVPLIGKYFNGGLSITDLFVRFGEHLLFGYGLLNIFNARLFSLDMRLDAVMFVIAYAMTAVIIYIECNKIFSNVRLIVLGLIFVPLCFLCFTLVSPPILNMSTQFAWGSSVALLIAWLLQRDFDASSANQKGPIWPIAGILVLIPLYYLIFSGAYFPGLIFGLGGICFFQMISIKKWFDHHILIIAIEGAICTFIYLFYMFILLTSGQGAASKGIMNYFTDPIGTILFYLAGLGSSLMDLHTLEAAPWVYLILGIVLVFISVVSIYLFILSGMYRKTLLPFYCMCYTLGIITSVRFGRGLYGNYLWITNEWYAFHMRFFVIGVVWILSYVLLMYIRDNIPWEQAQ